MTKKRIFTILACCIAVLFLLGVLRVGRASDWFGLKTLKWEAENPDRVGSGYRYGYRWDPEESTVTGLDVEWINGSIELRSSNSKVIRITERSYSGDLKESKKLRLSSSGGVLHIRWSGEFLRLAILDNTRKDLIVDIPASIAQEMTSLKCANTSGRITATGFTADVLDFSSTAGSLELSELQGERLIASTASGDISALDVSASERLDISSTSGSIRVTGETDFAVLDDTSGPVDYSGSARQINAHTVSGSVQMDLSICPEESFLDSVSGSVALLIPRDSGFQVVYDSVSGSFASDFPLNGGSARSDRLRHGSGEAKLEFATTSGEMSLLINR